VLLLIHAAATWFMVGVIWFVQIVHYPLFDHLAGGVAASYAYEHQRRTGWVVGPVMLIEMASATLLGLFRPAGVPLALVLAGGLLIAIVWGSTFLVQVPIHARLLEGYDAALQRRLVVTNWIRTVAWTARGAIALEMIREGLGPFSG
jgi:hypothetical protein